MASQYRLNERVLMGAVELLRQRFPLDHPTLDRLHALAGRLEHLSRVADRAHSEQQAGESLYHPCEPVQPRGLIFEETRPRNL